MASERILVVDDEPYVRTVISAMLEKAQYRPVLASNGLEALERLQADPPYDLVLSDIMMEGMDGMSLLDRLRETQPETPMVMVTAIHDVGVAISAIRKGAYDYLLKPFEKEQLLATVRRALEHRRLAQQNSMYQSNLEQLVAARTDMLRQAISDLERSYDITLEALGDALDLKDAETEGHSKRVTGYTVALARAMGLSPTDIRTIARGAFLHDIGKMAIPDAILLKPGRLDGDERSVMRDHCARGYQILSKIPYLREAAEIVYCHQEHFDGSGYPRGLKGEQIPLGARIFAVADTLDAITSDRPYRKANSFTAARKEIQRCAGTQFDPQVVDMYLNMPDVLWVDLRKEISQHARFSPFAYDGTGDEASN
ncbi:HD domain-containing phosphohydrolase [Alloacidobacterium sp.]|uniref:HD domain-containing phosphohydrolase n=1 Tax=Alloacidobacterium sp. TaxID=2951999 RepID=UPI002D752F98|nr:HD domain-containing phosphohydrolase [Alloacidobacterium sp.]HYK37665.1 HD domain-containing phosphohydrolase [Alloacidobacterium sp.]